LKVSLRLRSLSKSIASLKVWSFLFTGFQVVLSGLRRRRVPVVLELGVGQTGFACVAMILGYFGRRVHVTEFPGIDRDGISIEIIARLARSFEMSATVLNVTRSELSQVNLPAIAQFNSNHFVVLERLNGRHARVIDPSIGHMKLTREAFDKQFTGKILTVKPGLRFKGQLSSISPSWRFYLSYLWRQYIAYVAHARGILIQITGVWFLLLILGLAMPVMTEILIDRILPFKIVSVMPILGIAMVVVVITQLVTTYLRFILVVYLHARIDTHMMLNFVEHLTLLPLSFFHQRTHGDVLMRGGLVQRIRELLTVHVITVVLFGSLVLIYLSVLLIKAPLFGLLVLTLGLLQIGFLYGTRRRVYNLSQSELAAQTATQSYLVEALSGIETLKASGAEDQAVKGWNKLFLTSLGFSLHRSHLTALIDTLMNGLRTLSPIVLLWVGAYQVLDNQVTLGTMLAQNAIAMTFFSWLTTVVSSAQKLQEAPAYIDRIIDVLDTAPEQDIRAVKENFTLTGHLVVENLSFKYGAHSPYVLKDISFTVEPGQKVALVGRTGSGKSTLVRLLLGVYARTGGEIYYDGMPLDRLNYRSLRNQCGVVLQESFLFKESIKANIAFNDAEIPLEKVIKAARLAAIHDDIMRMPLAYETPAIESGAALSGGQRQRIAIARAIVREPAVLFLDEATSQLDMVTEQQIDDQLTALSCTRIVISHRLATVRNADLILVLDEGRIIQRGTHDELVALNGHYATIIRTLVESEVSAVAVV
jgi:ABC-type bacteriocin/lantibiotic exporter with double-glycine peptidase domain